ncbi:(Fe-S)-binding protein [Aureliella helgolandensis]|uniref:Lactate utilization protein A n=1 Tax=Aureliella helgolandensis TaxID=2527968 RepID=A0A518G3A8_9BACT|nr:(Fe-S)-binding protein [Aureliella helgolandensis]QDV23040.1 Lactate utilization protein A [Aureliella helgolandensis]
MRIGLFIPCYVDQFFPQIGLATVEILESFSGLTVEFPESQTCCGQPMANTGCIEDTRPIAEKFLDVFSEYDHVVSPSGSCVSMVRNHYKGFFHNDARFEKLRPCVWELCEFLVDVLQVNAFTQPFPHRVGLHSSCHGLRELRLDACSELQGPQVSKVRRVLEMVPKLELVDLERSDECCGFGGTFAVAEEGVSVLMGKDRVEDHVRAGAEVMTATDASCLMHMDGLIRRNHRPLRIMHIAEILAGHPIPSAPPT